MITTKKCFILSRTFESLSFTLLIKLKKKKNKLYYKISTDKQKENNENEQLTTYYVVTANL